MPDPLTQWPEYPRHRTELDARPALLRRPEDLSDDEYAAVRTLTESDWSWVSRPYLAARGHDPATVDALVARGVLEPWDLTDEEGSGRRPPPVGPCVTLSVPAADRLMVEIAEFGQNDRPRWKSWEFDEHGNRVLDEGLPPLICPLYECRLIYLERVPDKRRGPEAEVEYLLDGYSGEPLAVLGQAKVPIDKRLGKPRAKVSKKKGRARAKVRAG
jgi:hypothetical protein